MIKQTITYKDWNGVERTEDFYFNLSESEIVEFAATAEGDLGEELKQMVDSKDGAKIMETFKNLLARSYGEKSPDGKRFMKGENQQLFKAFSETEAYNKLFMRMVTEPEFAATFIQGVIPQELPKK